MKQKTKLQHWITSVITGLALAGSLSSASAQLELNLFTFDTDISAVTGTGGDGAALTTLAWDPLNNGGGGSGSLKATANWLANNGTSWHELQINLDTVWPGVNAGAWVTIDFDIKIDEPNSFLGPNGNYGFTQPVLQSFTGGPGWQELANATIISTSGWQHVTANLAAFGAAAINRVVIRLGSNGGQNVTNTVVYYLDNIKLTAPPLPPPTLGKLEPATTPGLTLLPGGGSQWQRVMLFPGPLGNDFGWYNRGNPVSYAFTVTNFPTVNDYAANIFLVPSAHMQYGPNDTSVDWNCTNGLFFNFTANTTNPATNWNVNLSAKTNLNAGNPNLTLLTFDYAILPTGKWTLRFDNNTDFTIIAPNGFTTNGSMPADVANLVSGNDQANLGLTPYIGIMPRTPEHIGKPAIFSRIEITGVPTPIDDTFTTDLDTNTWSRLADYPPGIFVTTSDLMYYASWNTPNDQGYSTLVTAPVLSAPLKDLVPSSQWLLINGTRKALISKSSLQAVSGTTNSALFAVLKRVFTKLQILLPGETAAPGTLTGKTGTPTAQAAGVPFNVTVNAVDANWYPIATATDMIHLTSDDGGFGAPPFDSALAGGTVSIEVSLTTTGSTITASDATDPTKTPNTSSAVTVNP